jgi:hypothetical protein
MNQETDRELLELAAQAAGIPYVKPAPDYSGVYGLQAGSENPMQCRSWNPLQDDGDALRLAVKLGLVLSPSKVSAMAWQPNAIERDSIWEPLNPDPYSATRRAIVRAAAEIGRSAK